MSGISDYVALAAESRAKELDAAIMRFRECGVELERFSIQEHGFDIERRFGQKSVLCVDGIPRFSWRMICNLPGWPN